MQATENDFLQALYSAFTSVNGQYLDLIIVALHNLVNYFLPQKLTLEIVHHLLML